MKDNKTHLWGLELLLAKSKAQKQEQSVLSLEVEVIHLIDSLSLSLTPCFYFLLYSLVEPSQSFNALVSTLLQNKKYVGYEPRFIQSPRFLHEVPENTHTHTQTHTCTQSWLFPWLSVFCVCPEFLFGDRQARRGRYTMLMS